jgi:hypothetical protein
MAIIIPLVSQFDNSGVKGAIKEFQSLEGAGAKANFAIKKAALPAAAAIGAVGLAAFDAAKGALEDAAAQELLAKAIGKNTNATDKQIAANEDWISQQGKLLGIADDDLRPALSRLVTQTGSLTKAQEGAALAMDIAAATGKPLSTVTEAIAKAYGGNTAALAKLDPKLRGLIKGGLDAEGAMSVLADTFGGAATTNANTAQGQFQRLQLSLSETKETIGAALLPIIEKILPVLTSFGNWASENTAVFLTVAGVITTGTPDCSAGAAFSHNPHVRKLKALMNKARPRTGTIRCCDWNSWSLDITAAAPSVSDFASPRLAPSLA